MRFLDTPGRESPRIPQQNAPLDAIGRGWNGGNRPFNQGVAGSIPARPTNEIGLFSVSQKTPVSGGDLRQIRGILSVISARTGRDGGA